MKSILAILGKGLLPAAMALLVGCQSSTDRGTTAPAAHFLRATPNTRSLSPASVFEDSSSGIEATNHAADGQVASEVRNAAYLRFIETSTTGDVVNPNSGSTPDMSSDGAMPAELPGETIPSTAVRAFPGTTLEDAVATALMQNPDLTTLRGQANVSAAVLGVARTYPWNPFVQGQFFPPGHPHDPGTGRGTGSGKSNYYVWVMQRFELAHQRRFRTQSAAAALSQVQLNIEQAELLNVAQTMRLYFTALYQYRLRNLAQESADLNNTLLGVVERRFKANLATVAEVTTARVAARQTARQAHLMDAGYQAALLALRQQMNLPLHEPLELSDELTTFAWLPVVGIDPEAAPPVETYLEGNALAYELVEGRPDVRAAGAGISVASANMRLARAARIPDLSAGPIYDTGDDGTQFLGMRLQTDIPVWNNGTPLVRQRGAEMQQQFLTRDQLRQRAILEAQTALDRYERARRLVEASQVDFSGPVGTMPTELREITAQFQAGQAEILAVFLTQNNLIQDRRTYYDLLNELAQAAAGVVQATALPPERIVRRPAPTPGT